jgi:5-methylcytosine-specific restriction endonuclease McrA
MAELHRLWAKKNAEKIRQASRKYARANYNKRLENTRRYKARKRANSVVPFTQDELNAKIAYWGGRCYLRIYCDGVPFETMDHVIPLAQGGPHVLSNLRPACRSCNSAKGDRILA